MSLFDTFDPDKRAVLNPEDAVGSLAGIPKTVIMTFSSKVEDIFVKKYNPRTIGHLYGGRPLPIYKAQYKGIEVGLFRTFMGAPMTVAFGEELIAMGVENIIIFGSCGVLDSSLEPGHVIIPTEAYRDEGTSYHYMISGDYINIDTSEFTADFFDKINVPVTKTRIWTTDGLYRETRSNMEKRRNDGCRVVDMECSAIMALGKFRNKKIYQFVYAEDSLDGVNWEPRTMGKVPPEASETYLQMALELCVKVDGRK